MYRNEPIVMKELICQYRDEQYSVRDNGEVFKHSRAGGRKRPTDNKWTFGKLNKRSGYLEIATVNVHRIVATAFLGVASTKEHVVDHIDINKQNNRPTNLRWVTRLENILLNSITAKRIAKVCGSVEEFLANPSKFRDKFPDPNFSWMCTVSAEEAQISLRRMLSWANSDKDSSGGSLGNRNTMKRQDIKDLEIPAITSNASQRDWGIPSEFPCCPGEYGGEPVKSYAANLKIGNLFCRNGVYSSSVFLSSLSSDNQSLFVVSNSIENDAIKSYALAKITFENNKFVHASLGSFFTQAGAEKRFFLSQGLEWTGEDTIDDYT
jgi:hypothetical protein